MIFFLRNPLFLFCCLLVLILIVFAMLIPLNFESTGFWYYHVNSPSPDQLSDPDNSLRSLLAYHSVDLPERGPRFSEEKVKLGRKLFWDKILSSNRDVSCASCHHPAFFTSDGRSLSVGTKSKGAFPHREVGSDRRFHSRNSSDLFNRGSSEWETMFWDNRLRRTSTGKIKSLRFPFEPPGELNHLLTHVNFEPLTARFMRGLPGDTTVDGKDNSISDYQMHPGNPPSRIWEYFFERVWKIPGYRNLFQEAFPEVASKKFGFQHVAKSMTAYEVEAFTFYDSPWDRYLQGEDSALSRSAKKGAILFYGKAKCVNCHAGSLLTDQETYNIAVPHIGMGLPETSPIDPGAYQMTRNKEDLFAFRTPPLRNVQVTGPWMHNGAYKSLEGALRHHVKPVTSLMNYEAADFYRDKPERLEPWPVKRAQLRSFPIIGDTQTLPKVSQSRELKRRIAGNLDSKIAEVPDLTDREIDWIIDFLRSLTSPSVYPAETGHYTEAMKKTLPETVPSGLPIDTISVEEVRR